MQCRSGDACRKTLMPSRMETMEYPPIEPARLQQLLGTAVPRATLPEWYLRRWHFHPDGYLSRAGVRWYDRVIRRLYSWPAEDAVYAFVSSVVAGSDARTVIDIGCGSGRLLAALARHGAGLTLTGVDLSPVMLARARAVAPDGSTIAFVQADASELASFEAEHGHVDSVVVSHVLGHVPARIADAIVRNGASLLNGGGQLVVVDHSWHPLPSMPDTLRHRSSRRFRAGAITVQVFQKVSVMPLPIKGGVA